MLVDYDKQCMHNAIFRTTTRKNLRNKLKNTAGKSNGILKIASIFSDHNGIS